jgi:hypothetical protein
MAALIARALPASAAEVQVRGATHDDFSRVVYTVPNGITPRWMRLGDLLILVFPHAGHVPGMTPAPKNILSVSGGTDQAAIGVPPGEQLHVWQIDQRVVVDVFGANAPTPGQAPRGATAPAPSRAPAPAAAPARTPAAGPAHP